MKTLKQFENTILNSLRFPSNLNRTIQQIRLKLMCKKNLIFISVQIFCVQHTTCFHSSLEKKINQILPGTVVYSHLNHKLLFSFAKSLLVYCCIKNLIMSLVFENRSVFLPDKLGTVRSVNVFLFFDSFDSTSDMQIPSVTHLNNSL